jgi:protein-tyrosine-phosphatase
VDLLVVCTGNAARSVMAGAALEASIPGVRVATAGTLVVDGQPMSWRTRAALEGVGLAIPDHRSRQAGAIDLDRADLIVALAPEHVLWVRREHPKAAARTATLKRLVRDLPVDPRPLAERVADLGLAAAQLGDWEEVVDPGGGDADDFLACAREIVGFVDVLVDKLVPRLGPHEPERPRS